MDNKELLDALVQIPEIVKAAETFKLTTEKTVSIFAEALRKRPQAVIPETELTKICERVSRTQCSPPDPKKLAELIAPSLIDSISDTVEDKAKRALDDAAADVRRTCSHSLENGLKEIADKRLKKKCFFMVIIIYHLVIFIAVLLFVNYNSDFYWGQKYCKVYASKYITTAEKDSIKTSVYPVAILPLGYADDSESAKKRITYNLSIIKKREKEAKKNKGVYSTEKSIKI